MDAALTTALTEGFADVGTTIAAVLALGVVAAIGVVASTGGAKYAIKWVRGIFSAAK